MLVGEKCSVKADRAETLALRVEGIPEELRGLRCWVAWRFVRRLGKDKPDKVPLSPRSGRPASVRDPDAWGTIDAALRLVDRDRADSVGFVFADAGGMHAGIDLDGCRDPGTGAVEDWAVTVADALDSWTEVSPSARGLHVVVRGRLPDPGRGRKRDGVEVYDRGRFFALTGHRLESMPAAPQERQDELLALYERLAPPHRRQEVDPAVVADRPCPSVLSADDAAVIRLAHAHSPTFRHVWRGGLVADRRTGRLDASATDWCLARMLGFYLGRDVDRIERLMRQSGLARAKWDRRLGRTTYLRFTVALAAGSQVKFFNYRARPESPRRSSPPNSPTPGEEGRTCAGSLCVSVSSEKLTLPDLYRRACRAPEPMVVPGVGRKVLWRLRVLAALCRLLARGGRTFALDCRRAAGVFGVNWKTMARLLRRLVDAGILEVVVRGDWAERKAHEYRWLGEGAGQQTVTGEGIDHGT
jgi:hypothetical protein